MIAVYPLQPKEAFSKSDRLDFAGGAFATLKQTMMQPGFMELLVCTIASIIVHGELPQRLPIPSIPNQSFTRKCQRAPAPWLDE
jgi:hypothetical protein